MQDLRTCNQCGTVAEKSTFPLCKVNKVDKEGNPYVYSYHSGKCRRCTSANSTKRNFKRRDQINERRRHRLHTDQEFSSRINRLKMESYYRNFEKVLFRNAKYRAKKYGLPFEITLEDVVIPEVCPLLKTPFELGSGAHAYSPSLDKIIPELGYTKENTRVISAKANLMKSNANISELREFIQNLEGYIAHLT